MIKGKISEDLIVEWSEKTITCPLCGTPNQLFEKGGYDICDVCYWKDDNAERNPYDSDNINNISFAEAKKIWESGKEIPYES